MIREDELASLIFGDAQLGQLRLFWKIIQKRDHHPGRILASFPPEMPAPDETLEALRRAEQDGHGESISFLDLIFDGLPELFRFFFIAVENHVAALHIRLDICQSQRLVQAFQVCHADLLLSADVDPPQERNVSLHRYSIDSILGEWKKKACQNGRLN